MATGSRQCLARSAASHAVALALMIPACHAPPRAPQPLAGETDIVVGTEFPLDSAVLNESRTITTYLPADYATRDERFPVLYLIDGGIAQDYLPVAGMAALAWLSGQYREFIVIGVQTNNRRYELTTPSTVATDLEAIPKNGGADDFRRFITEEIQPLVNRRYRTTGETAVLGESLAGLFIVDTFLRAPDSFDHYIAVSPSLWWNDQALAHAAKDHLQSDGFPPGRSLYLTVGDETDIQRALPPLLSALKEHAPNALRWRYDPMPAEHHHTIYHPATLNALRWIFAEE